MDPNQDRGDHKATAGVVTRAAVATNGVAVSKVAKARGTAALPGINNKVASGAVSKAVVTTRAAQLEEAAVAATTVSFVLFLFVLQLIYLCDDLCSRKRQLGWSDAR